MCHLPLNSLLHSAVALRSADGALIEVAVIDAIVVTFCWSFWAAFRSAATDTDTFLVWERFLLVPKSLYFDSTDARSTTRLVKLVNEYASLSERLFLVFLTLSTSLLSLNLDALVTEVSWSSLSLIDSMDFVSWPCLTRWRSRSMDVSKRLIDPFCSVLKSFTFFIMNFDAFGSFTFVHCRIGLSISLMLLVTVAVRIAKWRWSVDDVVSTVDVVFANGDTARELTDSNGARSIHRSARATRAPAAPMTACVGATATHYSTVRLRWTLSVPVVKHK